MSSIGSVLKKRVKSVLPQTFKSPIPYVTKSTQYASSASGIRGVLGIIQQYYFQRCRSSRITVSGNKFFKCQFYPPEHLLGLFRKSRPSMRVKYEQDAFILNDPTIETQIKNRLSTWKTMHLMSYSYQRVQIRRMMRVKFHEAFAKESGARDGLYVFNTRLLPMTEQEWDIFNKGIENAIKTAKDMDCSKLVSMDNRRVEWRKVRSLLETNDIEIPEWFDDVESQYGKKKDITTTKKRQRKPTW